MEIKRSAIVGRPAKFPQVKRRLRNAIIRGHLQPEARLPTFPEVARRMGVGSVTAKRAIDELVAEGWLTARRGVGTFVNTRKSIAPIVLTLSSANNPLFYLFTASELDEFHEQNPGVRVIYTAESESDLVVSDSYGMIVRCIRGQQWHSIAALRREFGLPGWDLPALASRTAEWKGELFGLPLHLDLKVFQLNPRVMQEFGLPLPRRYLDWDTFQTIVRSCRKDEDGDGVIECFGSVFHLPSYEWQIPFWQNGGRLDEETAFFQPKAIEAIDRLWRLIHVERVLPMEPPIGFGEMFVKQVRRRFYSGKLATRMIGTREVFHDCPFPSEILLPRFGETHRQFMDGVLIGISRQCDYPEIAMNFLDFCHRRYVQENGEYPFAQGESNRGILRSRPDLKELFLEAAKHGIDPLHEGLPERTWGIENEIFQWFRLFQDRGTTMDRIREIWNRSSMAGQTSTEFGRALGDEGPTEEEEYLSKTRSLT